MSNTESSTFAANPYRREDKKTEQYALKHAKERAALFPGSVVTLKRVCPPGKKQNANNPGECYDPDEEELFYEVREPKGTFHAPGVTTRTGSWSTGAMTGGKKRKARKSRKTRKTRKSRR